MKALEADLTEPVIGLRPSTEDMSIMQDLFVRLSMLGRIILVIINYE